MAVIAPPDGGTPKLHPINPVAEVVTAVFFLKKGRLAHTSHQLALLLFPTHLSQLSISTKTPTQGCHTFLKLIQLLLSSNFSEPSVMSTQDNDLATLLSPNYTFHNTIETVTTHRLIKATDAADDVSGEKGKRSYEINNFVHACISLTGV